MLAPGMKMTTVQVRIWPTQKFQALNKSQKQNRSKLRLESEVAKKTNLVLFMLCKKVNEEQALDEELALICLF